MVILVRMDVLECSARLYNHAFCERLSSILGPEAYTLTVIAVLMEVSKACNTEFFVSRQGNASVGLSHLDSSMEESSVNLNEPSTPKYIAGC